MIDNFRGNYRFLSNFYILQYPIHWCGINYPSSEHFYQAMKTLDYELRVYISQIKECRDAKKFGGELLLRPDWDFVDELIMETAVFLKFNINPHLTNRLAATAGKTLIEGNTWHDNYWGDCRCAKCVNKTGLNKLGQILMNTRQKMLTIG